MNKKSKLLSVSLTAILLILATSLICSANFDTGLGESLSEPSAAEENIFTELYKYLKDNADKILSALSFAGTLLVAFSYRSGLLPVMENALGKLSSRLEKIENGFSDGEKALRESLSEIIAAAQEETQRLHKTVKELQTELADSKAVKRNTEELKSIFLSEAEMLAEVFMTSSLSQYQKDRISKSLSDMRERLLWVGGENEVEN